MRSGLPQSVTCEARTVSARSLEDEGRARIHVAPIKMNPFVLEIVCKEMHMTDGALCSLKKNVRLARNNLVRPRAENAKLRTQR